MELIEKMRKELLRRRYSLRTIDTYLYCVNKFLKNSDNLRPTKYEAIDYLDNLAKKGVSGSTINVYLQSIKFLMEEILHKRRTFYNIKYSKTPKSLPTVLGKEEVLALLDSIKNKKHSLAIKLMYSAGLRVSELVHLKINDFEFDKNFGWVRKGKGNKDRLFIIADKLNNELKDYIKENMLEPDSWIFQGYKFHHLSQKSIYMIVKKAAKKAKIIKRISPHTLRHSFSTHLIENGYTLTDVQSLLGHASPETTKIYLHIASPKMIGIKSPFDSLGDAGVNLGSKNFESRRIKDKEY